MSDTASSSSSSSSGSDSEENNSEIEEERERLNDSGFNQYLGFHWLRNMEKNPNRFIQPTLTSTSASTIFFLCEYMRSDLFVFATAINILERYIYKAKKSGFKIKHPALTLLTSVYMADKLNGIQPTYDVRRVAAIYRILRAKPSKPDDCLRIRKMEIHVLKMLKLSLPGINVVEDLQTVMHMLIRPLALRYHRLKRSADSLMKFYLIHQKEIYDQVVRMESKRHAWWINFKTTMQSRFFVPVALILAALDHSNITQRKHLRDIINLLYKAARLDAAKVKQYSDIIRATFKRVHKTNRRAVKNAAIGDI